MAKAFWGARGSQKAGIKERAPGEALVICAMTTKDLKQMHSEPLNDTESMAEDNRPESTVTIGLNVPKERQWHLLERLQEYNDVFSFGPVEYLTLTPWL